MIQSLNKNITNQRIKMPYPHVKLLEPSDAVALVAPSIPKGNLAVICEFEGTTRKIASVAYSALSLLTLVKVSKLILCKDEITARPINSVDDIMEAML